MVQVCLQVDSAMTDVLYCLGKADGETWNED